MANVDIGGVLGDAQAPLCATVIPLWLFDSRYLTCELPAEPLAPLRIRNISPSNCHIAKAPKKRHATCLIALQASCSAWHMRYCDSPILTAFCGDASLRLDDRDPGLPQSSPASPPPRPRTMLSLLRNSPDNSVKQATNIVLVTR